MRPAPKSRQNQASRLEELHVLFRGHGGQGCLGGHPVPTQDVEAGHGADAGDGREQVLVPHVRGGDDAHGVGGARAGFPASEDYDGVTRVDKVALHGQVQGLPDAAVHVSRPLVHLGVWNRQVSTLQSFVSSFASPPPTTPPLCVCVCVHACMCVWVCARMCVCMHACVCVCMYAYLHVSVCVCEQVCACLSMHACVCMHVCACMCMRACACKFYMISGSKSEISTITTFPLQQHHIRNAPESEAEAELLSFRSLNAFY